MARSKTIRVHLCGSLLTLIALGTGPVLQAAEPGVEGLGETGTDPRDFAPKFMPYYRYTELENGLEENVLTLFGL